MINYHTDLTKFQRDMLESLARLERRDETPYGLAIADDLREKYDKVHHARLYTNLDNLVEMGLVERSELDQRTNRLELTEKGRGLLIDRLQASADALGFEIHERDERLIADGGSK